MQSTAERRGAAAARPGRASLFLIEITIAIAFFAATSAICMLLFAKTRALSKESRDITMAAIAAQNVAEVFKSSGDAERCMDALGMHSEGGSAYLFFDSAWQPQQLREGASYLLKMRPLPAQGGLRSVRVGVYAGEGQEPIHEITVTKYIRPGTVIANE